MHGYAFYFIDSHVVIGGGAIAGRGDTPGTIDGGLGSVGTGPGGVGGVPGGVGGVPGGVGAVKPSKGYLSGKYCLR